MGGANNPQVNLSPEPIDKRDGSALILDLVEGSRVHRAKKTKIFAYGLLLIRSISKRWVKSGHFSKEKWHKNKVNSVSYEKTLPFIKFFTSRRLV